MVPSGYPAPHRCRETAAKERVQPAAVEKDYYLTRLLWALGQLLGERLLLKGGSLLSKVDLGFRRRSELEARGYRPRRVRRTMPAKRLSSSKALRPTRPFAARLDELIEEAIADAYGDSEQAAGLFTMMEEHLELPFRCKSWAPRPRSRASIYDDP
jgi:hypothetical protein